MARSAFASRAARWLLGGVVAVVVLVLLAILLLPRTDWAQRQVRTGLTDALSGVVRGSVEVGDVQGNLLREATLTDVAVTDSAGSEVLRIGRLSAQYALLPLLRQRIVIEELELGDVSAFVEQGPEGEWNVTSLVSADSAEAAPDTASTGWGSWIRIENASIQNGRVVVRTPWSPPEDLEGEARDSAVTVALSDSSRSRVERADTRGAIDFQVVREVRELDMHVSGLVAAHPEEPISGTLTSLSATALPFRPPAAEIRNLEGSFTLGENDLSLRQLALALPRSRITVGADVELESGTGRVEVSVDSLAFGDLQWLDPSLPTEGSARAQILAQRTPEGTRVSASDVDARMEDAALTGRTEMWLPAVESEGPDGPSWSVEDTDLRFSGVDQGLVERFAPGVDSALDGTLSGRARLTTAGEGQEAASAPPNALRVDVDLQHASPRAGSSSVGLEGLVSLTAMEVRDLAIVLDPLQIAALESVTGPLPPGGSLEGRAVVNGALNGRVEATLDLRHDVATGPTRLTGTVETDAAAIETDSASTPPSAGDERQFAADLAAAPLSMETVGTFVPAAELRGSPDATVRARGTLERVVGEIGLTVERGGSLSASGTVDARGASLEYDLRVLFDAFDGSRLSARAPAGSIEGSVTTRGRGTEPATMDAELEADLRSMPTPEESRDGPRAASRLEAVGPARARIQAEIQDGLLRMDRAEVEAASARVSLDGSFGLVEERTGTLDFSIQVDSLSRIAAVTGNAATERSPAATDTTAADARAADASADAGPDSVMALEGGVETEGSISGNLERIDIEGAIQYQDLLAFGIGTSSGSVDFVGEDLRDERPRLAAEFGVDSLRVADFEYDSVSGEVEYLGSPDEGEGSARVGIFQDPGRDYRLQAGYTLELDRQELLLEQVDLRFDTLRWRSAGPGTVEWSGQGVAVDSLELEGSGGGRIFVDGRFATGEEGEVSPPPRDTLSVIVEELQISQILGLVQDTLDATGILDLDVRATGPPQDAHATASLSLRDVVYGETPLPGLSAEAVSVPGEIELQAWMVGSGRGVMPAGDTLLRARGTAAIDLFGDQGDAPRTLNVTVEAEELPLDGLPRFTSAVSDLRGLIRGEAVIGGTVDDPEVEGEVALDVGQVDVVWPGIELRDVAGRVRMQGDSVVLDSLVAYSRGGTIRGSGGADLSSASGPHLDFVLSARDAQVLNNEYGDNIRIDADVRMAGPYDGLTVAGDMQLLEGILYVPDTGGDVLDLESPRAQFALSEMNVDPERIPDESPLAAGLQVVVGLDVGRNTWVRMEEGNAEIYTPEGDPLLLQYDASSGFYLEGVLNADRGEYEFAGRRFELSTGTASFLASRTIDPLLHLTATHEVPRPGREALTIQINVTGRLTEPRVVLTSDANPPLSQTDLISYLVFGTSSSSLLQPGSSGLAGGGPGDLGALAGQRLASLALGALVEEGLDELETSATRSGLDVFRLAPAELPDELAFDGYVENLLRGTRIEAGSYLTPRVFLGATGTATTESWPGLTLEYRAPSGIRASALWEPRYLPSAPTFETEVTATQTRALGFFLFWERRASSRIQGPVAAPAESGDGDDGTGGAGAPDTGPSSVP